MDDLSKVIWKNKSVSNLFEEIYDNSRKKEKMIRELIDQLKPMVKDPGDAIILVPVIKEYLEMSIKNDEHLIKLAGIVQKAIQNGGENKKDADLLSEEDKKQLLSGIHSIK